MEEAEVRRHFPDFTSVLDMVQSANLAEGGKVRLGNGATVVFAFDPQHRVISIRTSDGRLEIAPGIRVGTPFAHVAQEYPGVQMKSEVGYARGMEIAPNLWVCDDLYKEDENMTGKVEWIALRTMPL